MESIEPSKPISIIEFLERLPPIIKEMFKSNIAYHHKIIFEEYLKRMSSASYGFGTWKNDFAWRNSPQGQPFWDRLLNHKIIITIPFPTSDFSYSIQLEDYYCRNNQYKSIIELIKKQGVIDFNIENFKMVLIDSSGRKHE